MRSLFVDSKGWIWLGGDDGVTVLNTDEDGLGLRSVVNLALDDLGRVWAVTADGEITIFGPDLTVLASFGGGYDRADGDWTTAVQIDGDRGWPSAIRCRARPLRSFCRLCAVDSRTRLEQGIGKGRDWGWPDKPCPPSSPVTVAQPSANTAQFSTNHHERR